MTTTPLPPLPNTPYLLYYQWPDDEYGFNGSEVVDCDAYTADQMQAYATQARADLEAENQRLRVFVMQVLKGCLTGRIKSPPIVIEDLEATDLKLISLGDAARAALKGSNHD